MSVTQMGKLIMRVAEPFSLGSKVAVVHLCFSH